MPKRYLRNPLLIFKNPYMVGFIVICILTYAMTFFVSPEQLLNIYSTPMAVLAAWGVAKWGGESVAALLNGDTSKEALGVVGVFCIMAFIALNRGNTVGVINWGWPDYKSSYTAAVLVLFALVGVTLFAIASRDTDPTKAKSPRTASFVTGFFSAALLIFSGAFHAIVTHAGKVWRILVTMFT